MSPSRELLQSLRSAFYPRVSSKLAARRGKKIILVPRRDILYVLAEDRLGYFCTANDRFTTDRTVQQIEEMLPPGEFFRINRGTVVNLSAVEEMYPWMTSGAWRVRLKNGVELDVSRDRVPDLRALVLL